MEQDTSNTLGHTQEQNRPASTLQLDNSTGEQQTDLCNDEWLLVFRYLSAADRIRAQLVCRRWRELARVSLKSTRTVSLSNKHNRPFKGRSRLHCLKVCLRMCGPRLRHLDLSNSVGYLLAPLLQDSALRLGSRLQELDLTRSRVDNTQLQTVAAELPRLTSLVLDQCKVSDGGVRCVSRLQWLRTLNLNDTAVTGKFFKEAPPSLTKICVENCRNLTDDGIHLMTQRCPNLETISIACCKNVTQLSLERIARNCSKLKRFTNIYSLQWSNSTLLSLCRLRFLEKLHVYDQGEDSVTDSVVGELSTHCPRMKVVSLMRCSQLTDAAFFQMSPWSHLENIDFTNSKHITDKGIVQFSSAHSGLKEVILRGCHRVGNTGVGHLLSKQPSLVQLDIAYCSQVTDEVLDEIDPSAQHTRGSQSLQIQICSTAITEEAAHKLTDELQCTVIWD